MFASTGKTLTTVVQNGGEIPDHMNLVPYTLAVAHASLSLKHFRIGPNGSHSSQRRPGRNPL